MVRYLIQQRGSVNVAGLHGRTPLMLAASTGQLAILGQLLGSVACAPNAMPVACAPNAMRSGMRSLSLLPVLPSLAASDIVCCGV